MIPRFVKDGTVIYQLFIDFIRNLGKTCIPKVGAAAINDPPF
jgi:hypothetical protein